MLQYIDSEDIGNKSFELYASVVNYNCAPFGVPFVDGLQVFYTGNRNYVQIVWQDVDERTPFVAELSFSDGNGGAIGDTLKAYGAEFADGRYGILFDVADVLQKIGRKHDYNANMHIDLALYDMPTITAVVDEVIPIIWGRNPIDIVNATGLLCAEFMDTTPNSGIKRLPPPAVWYIPTGVTGVLFAMFAGQMVRIPCSNFCDTDVAGMYNVMCMGESCTAYVVPFAWSDNSRTSPWLMLHIRYTQYLGIGNGSDDNDNNAVNIQIAAKVVGISYGEKATEYVPQCDDVEWSRSGGDITYELQLPQLDVYSYNYYVALLQHATKIDVNYNHDEFGVIMSSNNLQALPNVADLRKRDLTFKVIRHTSRL